MACFSHFETAPFDAHLHVNAIFLQQLSKWQILHKKRPFPEFVHNFGFTHYIAPSSRELSAKLTEGVRCAMRARVLRNFFNYTRQKEGSLSEVLFA